MKLYILQGSDVDGNDILGIYSNFEKAEAEKQRLLNLEQRSQKCLNEIRKLEDDYYFEHPTPEDSNDQLALNTEQWYDQFTIFLEEINQKEFAQVDPDAYSYYSTRPNYSRYDVVEMDLIE